MSAGPDECPDDKAGLAIRLARALADAHGQRALTEAVVDSFGDACLAVDAKRSFVVVNKAARRIFADAEVGLPVPSDWATLHRSFRPDGSPLPSEEGSLARGLRGLDTDQLVFTLQRPGADAPIWVEACGRPVRDADGRVVGAVTVYRDVTETKRRTDRYATLAANIPRSAVLLFDRELLCLAAEGSLFRELGLAQGDPIGKPMCQLLGIARDDKPCDGLDELYRQALEGAAGSLDVPFLGRTLALHAAPVRDVTGAVREGIVLAVDVTAERANEAANARSEQVYRAILEHLPEGAVFMVDRDLRYTSADGPILDKILQRTELRGGLVGRLVEEVVTPANREAVVATYRAALHGKSQKVQIDREGRHYEVSTVPIFQGGEITHALVFSRDVTDLRREAAELARARDTLARERAMLETMIAHIEDAVALLDAERRTIVANKSYADLLGLPLAEVVDMPRDRVAEILVPMLEDPTAFSLQFTSRATARIDEFVFARPRRRVMRRTWTPLRLLENDGFLVAWHDVTAERDLLRERERQLLVDPLTGIANRRAAETALRTEQERSHRLGSPLCVALFDIDHFKKVNDTYGHGAGDEVLRVVATTLAGEARLTDIVARWGGEEFVAVLNVPLEGARTFAERARRAVEAIAAATVGRVTTSVGVAEMRLGEAVHDTLTRADAKLYEAKTSGRNRVLC